ncbi:RNA binding effector protein-like protein Scp160 [Lindgomyces ingoldianus]|uniref:RNA binding effector protein-like protein Scp160 n=1 Tax=Lindgomyces ingoldianus TaxID=673940 RepID=A0ACB6QA63_9PLEO|nr:RNA binding effector protein-like protein Scp160 [Lindgomyces ingoldianus]KAF2463809.1 RNA binding effector protein-like protein Scp160 [Lindgomyces ingoldianus]
MAPEIATGGSSAPEGLTPAQMLMEQHDHHATVEDIVDEEDIAHPPPSAPLKADAADGAAPATMPSDKAAGKQKAGDAAAPAKKASANVPLNTASEELFPALGPVKPRPQASVPPAWGKKPASLTSNGLNGSTNGQSNATSRASTPASGMGTPVSLPVGRGPALPSMSLPGKHKEQISFHPSQLIPRQQLKKPLGDIIRDINKRSKARLEQKSGPGGLVIFEATGPVDAVRQSLKDIANELGSKQSIKVSVPASVRAFIIGRQGSKIQEIIKRTGARVNIPKQEIAEDEDSMVDVHIEGNALTAEMARREIEAIVNERTSTVNMRLKDIPAEYYPFLAGPHNALINNLEQGRDVRVQIPHYTTWDTQAPPQVPRNQPIPFVPQAKFPIQISGDRTAAQEVQAQLERQVEQLRRQLAIEQRSIERGRHQFIVGDRGGSLHDFLEETGCSIIIPPSTDDSETIYVVGPPDKIENGVNKLEDLAASMQMAMVDCAREHRGAHAQTHARNLTRYLRQRQALAELERMHEASIVVPTDRDGPTAWEIYARNGKNTMKARGDIQSVFAGHPPSRFSTVDVDPFYHQFLQQRNAQHIRDDTGVHVVFPSDSDDESPELILVYEGTTPSADYIIPRGPPPPAEVQAYKQALQQAQQFIQSITTAQQNIVSSELEAPPKFHDKIRRYVDREQSSLPRDVIPVQVLFGDRRPQARRHSNTSLALRGPSNAVDDLTAKILAFVEQEEKDELERGFTMTFDFPQKFANFLIGKRGENIRKLRDEFDVDIQVNDGKVELKGPQAKANACKTHIMALAKRLEDEATHTLKIKSQYHRDLIGAKGSQVNRLQDRYNVRINFPRTTNHANDDDAATEGGASQKNFRSQGPDEVVIRGPRKGADEARDELLNLLQWTIDNSYSDTVSVAQSQVPSLIGSGGREMENLRLATGCQIDVPGAREGADPSGRAEIRLRGTKKQVEEAKKLLQERAKVFDDTVVKIIDVDRKHHRTLIGGSGSNIRTIVTSAGGPDNARDLARMVRFPRADSDDSTIRVEGPKAVVEKIVASIQAQAASLDSQITETIDVSPDKHRILIGRGGEARRNLESQFGVQLDIPKQGTTGAARNQVKITGEPAQVENAKQHILDLVKGQEGETIQVPLHLHHSISDNGQFFRRLRNEHKVTVDHGGQQVPPRPSPAEGGKARKGANGNTLPLITDDDTASGAEEKYSWEIVDNNPNHPSSSPATIPWILRGPADNLPRARQAVESAIEANSKPSSTGYLILPDPRSYRLVVGSGGNTINGIRKKTGTRVQVPRDQAKDEAIEIVGTREGVEEARRLILEVVGRGAGVGGRK